VGLERSSGARRAIEWGSSDRVGLERSGGARAIGWGSAKLLDRRAIGWGSSDRVGLERSSGARYKKIFGKPSSRLHCPLRNLATRSRGSGCSPRPHYRFNRHVLQAAEHVRAEERSRSAHLDSSAPSFACRAQRYARGLCPVLAVVWAADSLSTLRRLPAAGRPSLSFDAGMLTTGELARREASRSDPERLVAFSRHNRLACYQSSRFWPLPAAYRLDLLVAPAAGEHAVLNPDRLIDVQSCCQSRTRSPGPRCATRQIVALCRSPQPLTFQPLPLTSTNVSVRAAAFCPSVLSCMSQGSDFHLARHRLDPARTAASLCTAAWARAVL